MPNQAGSQWDALGHVFWRGRMYNGYPAQVTAGASGSTTTTGPAPGLSLHTAVWLYEHDVAAIATWGCEVREVIP
jgi:hypothetical protein